MTWWAGSRVDASLSLESEGLRVRTRKELAGQIEQLYDEHYHGLFRYLVHLGTNPVDADEFIQEAFFRLFQAFRDGVRVERPKSWLIGVLHHIRADEGRRSLRQVEYGMVDSREWDRKTHDPAPTPEAQAAERERIEHLRRAMAQLTERQYQYLLLRTEGLKLREIAEIFGVTVQSAAEVCTRAMERLGRLMQE